MGMSELLLMLTRNPSLEYVLHLQEIKMAANFLQNIHIVCVRCALYYTISSSLNSEFHF